MPIRQWINHRRKSLGLLILTSCVIGVYLTRCSLLAAAGSWLIDDDRLSEPVDCAIVLGGDPQTRPFYAAALYNAGWCRRVAYLNTVESPDTREGIRPTHGALMQAVFKNCGVPVDAISLIPGEVSSTREEVQHIAAYLESANVKSCAIVTSNFHTRRCRNLCDRIVNPQSGQIFILGAPTDGFGPHNWWQFRGGTHRYLAEFIKLGRDLFR